MVLHDAARAYADGDVARVQSITLGTMPAPHYPNERTETGLWNESDGRVLGRLVETAETRANGLPGDKLLIDQIEVLVR